ncbi:Uncharacterised protein [Campylobacter hyointestinalis subsp. hyointestinalis]|uniref:Uncharacterized protein n=1 Tax=Campylobacter hyointestinalis subsp. hyointestinalis TaxID=91352 RepID=A0A0S4STV7_CAMHY|nr:MULTISPECIES: hypothetical protein [Campylobacter]OCR99072.1 hypothetical protein A9K75_08655 [Campylobacter fetus subsp. testudinum]CUU89796.1 Uncharacterised protein [Campylobacter hyointestinalis subsp. hyointestinalis]
MDLKNLGKITKEELKTIEDMELDIDLNIIEELCGNTELQRQVMEFISLSDNERDRLFRIIP